VRPLHGLAGRTFIEECSDRQTEWSVGGRVGRADVGRSACWVTTNCDWKRRSVSFRPVWPPAACRQTLTYTSYFSAKRWTADGERRDSSSLTAQTLAAGGPRCDDVSALCISSWNRSPRYLVGRSAQCMAVIIRGAVLSRQNTSSPPNNRPPNMAAANFVMAEGCGLNGTAVTAVSIDQ